MIQKDSDFAKNHTDQNEKSGFFQINILIWQISVYNLHVNDTLFSRAFSWQQTRSSA